MNQKKIYIFIFSMDHKTLLNQPRFKATKFANTILHFKPKSSTNEN